MSRLTETHHRMQCNSCYAFVCITMKKKTTVNADIKPLFN
jgi:hypothetical protein